jgi:hypothetical protein
MSDGTDGRYVLKVRVDRYSLLSRAFRHSIHINFWPCDPSRPELSSGTQVNVRTKHIFSSHQGLFQSLFSSKSEKRSAGAVIVEARLPRSVLVPKQPVPVMLVIARASGSKTVFLQSVEILVGSTTCIQIKGDRSSDRGQTRILSKNNLNFILQSAQNEMLVQPIDITSGRTINFPNAFPPSFRSCNITRTYSLILRVGILEEGAKKTEQVQLEMDVELFTGGVTKAGTDGRILTERAQSDVPPLYVN